MIEWPKTSCYYRHLGYWLYEPVRFGNAFAEVIRAGTYQYPKRQVEEIAAATTTDRQPYPVQDGIAIIPIAGPIMKGGGSFGEVDSLEVRRNIRKAARDEDVAGIMILIDSPGGTVAGTEELANDVRDAGAVKPVFAHIEDLGASAAYWVASQASRITANATAEVGSIGTVAEVVDSSGAAKSEGITYHVVSTGPYKGSFSPGAPITEEQLAYLQQRVNDLNKFFLAAVAKGRKVSAKTVEGWADGRVWIAGTAAEMNLIDGVQRFDQAMATARKSIPRRSRASAIAKAEIDLAQNRIDIEEKRK
jgi:signal peptide peptidase SppA